MSSTATTVTHTALAIAQGAPSDTWIGDDLVHVDCPDTYDVDAITAEDIVHDPAITVVQ